MLGWLLKLLLLFLLVRALMQLVGGLLRGLVGVPQGAPAASSGTGGGHRGGRDSVPQSRGTLVRDPICGTYLPQDRALTSRSASGSTAFFCSEACRSAYDAQAARPR